MWGLDSYTWHKVRTSSLLTGIDHLHCLRYITLATASLGFKISYIKMKCEFLLYSDMLTLEVIYLTLVLLCTHHSIFVSSSRLLHSYTNMCTSEYRKYKCRGFRRAHNSALVLRLGTGLSRWPAALPLPLPQELPGNLLFVPSPPTAPTPAVRLVQGKHGQHGQKGFLWNSSDRTEAS